MIKFLFFDFRDLEIVKGFTRELELPRKHPRNPLMMADQPWEYNNMLLYGSALKRPGKPFQLWYASVQPNTWAYLGYAESDDGLTWRRPELDFHAHEGRRTNVILTQRVHGTAVIYDEAEPNEAMRYKLLSGVHPSNCICGFVSADGITWRKIRQDPVIASEPDCPIGFLRMRDGRYIAYYRHAPITGRRVSRAESCDFTSWTSDPRIVFEPDAADPPQVQFYGMGAAQYGPYELGTLWIFRTDATEFARGHMNGYEEAELAYAVTGYAWHRAAQGQPFIPHGEPGTWEGGNLQCASQPVFLDDEIRYYYAASTQRHCNNWELQPQRAGLGLAVARPDRFIALSAGADEAVLLTAAFQSPGPELFMNAAAQGGALCVEVLDVQAKPIAGLSAEEGTVVQGDGLAHPVRWSSGLGLPTDQRIRLRVTARNARLYSLFVPDPGEKPVYHRFRSPRQSFIG